MIQLSRDEGCCCCCSTITHYSRPCIPRRQWIVDPFFFHSSCFFLFALLTCIPFVLRICCCDRARLAALLH
ncbi:hypothetical protein BKA81DRAFT_83286 [Phyllosticta paracitricarpa]